jgi:hypothetical protein
MGRPIHKKYFGNRNIGVGGYQTTNSNAPAGDDRIGGEGVASVSQPVGGVGSFVVSDTYRNFPTLTASAPTLPGGVTALLSPVFEIATVTFASGGQTNADYVAGLSTSITGLGGGAIVNITEVASKVTAVDVTTAGTNRGEFRRDDFTGATLSTFQVLQAPNAGTDLQINITFRVKRIEVTEQGSGYVSVPSLTWGGHTFTGQTAPSLNVVTLTTDTGNVGSATNQENAIIIHAKIDSEATVRVGDIIKQSSSRRYKVKTSDGTAVCKLVADDTPATFQAYVKATDDNGNTYYVTKITSHKALLTQWTQNGEATWLFATGDLAPWTFTSTANGRVIIENA